MTILLEKFVEDNYLNINQAYKNVGKNIFGQWQLHDYQVKALKNILTALDFYFEKPSQNQINYLEAKYSNFGPKIINELKINDSDDAFNILKQYYPAKINTTNNAKYIDFKNFINSACFWMATGSGKTLVLIKLIEIMFKLINNNSTNLPDNDFLILAHKDKILDQIKYHVKLFNKTSSMTIKLEDLRNFSKIKKNYNGKTLFNNQLLVFYYRSDNITAKEKENELDYKNYLNNHNWYIFLDEAHKGDKKSSKAQQYFRVMSKNGFLFNFSATFTDEHDLATTVYNLNLEAFIQKGYGKHLKVMESTYKTMKNKNKIDKNNLNSITGKIKVIFKSLILLSAIKKAKNRLDQITNNIMYHNPLMMILVNEVSTLQSDLKYYFKLLKLILKNKNIISKIFNNAKSELLNSLLSNPDYFFVSSKTIPSNFMNQILNNLSINDVFKGVFNLSPSSTITLGNLEIITFPNNQKEIALKHTSSSEYFALIKVGNITSVKDYLINVLGFNHLVNNTRGSLFKKINNPGNSVNLLFGSRSFIEGWDSNRPNIINYINIGSRKAKKFTLQSMGRGIRIEPISNKRKRILRLNNKTKIMKKNGLNFNHKYLFKPIETLFIFATDNNTIDIILEGLEEQSIIKNKVENIDKSPNAKNNKKYHLIPEYTMKNRRISKKYLISNDDYNKIHDFLKKIPLEVFLLQNYEVNLEDLEYMKIHKISNGRNNKLFKINNNNSGLHPEDHLIKIIKYFRQKEKKLKNFKVVNGEINHYDSIKMEDNIYIKLQPLNGIVQSVKGNAPSFQQAPNTSSNCINISSNILKHFYLPYIYGEIKQNIKNKFEHIIKVDSEIVFIKKLENYVKNNLNYAYDFWGFSKLDEHLDEIYIPYFDSNMQIYRKFIPDFIFWFKNGTDLQVKFVDPKGSEYIRNFSDKIDGFEEVFKGKCSKIKVNNNRLLNNLYIDLWFWNSNLPTGLGKKYQKYWTTKFDDIFNLNKCKNNFICSGINIDIDEFMKEEQNINMKENITENNKSEAMDLYSKIYWLFKKYGNKILTKRRVPKNYSKYYKKIINNLPSPKKVKYEDVIFVFYHIIRGYLEIGHREKIDGEMIGRSCTDYINKHYDSSLNEEVKKIKEKSVLSNIIE